MTTELTKVDGLKAIESGLIAFEERKEAVTALAQSTVGLKLEDWKDKDTLKIVAAKRKEIKAERVAIQKEGKSMRDYITPISKMIKSKEDELVAILEPEEDRLQKMEDWAAEEAEKEKQAAIEAENARIQTRIDKLAEFGYQIDFKDVSTMSDDTFDKYLEAAQVQFEKEKAEKEEAERLDREKAEKEEAERQAEAKRIADERAELEKLRKEQQDREAEIKRKEEEVGRQKKAAQIDQRRAQLIQLGGIDEFKNDTYTYKDRVLATFHDIHDSPNEEWEQKLSEIPAAIEKYNAELLKIEEDRRNEIKAAEEAAKQKALDDAKEAERIKKDQEEKARITAERKAARQPDKVKIQSYIESVKAVPVPELKTEEGKEVMVKIQELIKRFDEYSTSKVEEL